MVDATDGPLAIEEHGLTGDRRTAAPVGRNGELIHRLCRPRCGGPARSAALLGEARHGRWRTAPADGGARVTRRYSGDGDTLILKMLFETAEGQVALDSNAFAANDVGLLSGEFGVRAGRQVGGFRQAFSRLALVHRPLALQAAAPVRKRIARGPGPGLIRWRGSGAGREGGTGRPRGPPA